MHLRLSPGMTLILLVTSSLPSQAQGPATATQHHKLLAKEVGVWDAEMSMWMAPGADPLETTAVETNEMLGDYWLSSVFKCDNPALPFEGHMKLGYDPAEEQFVGCWVDTMSPFWGLSKGSYHAETKSLVLVSTARDPESGEMKASTMISRFIDEDTKVFTIHAGEPGADGRPAKDAWKMMEIHYKRRK